MRRKDAILPFNLDEDFKAPAQWLKDTKLRMSRWTSNPQQYVAQPVLLASVDMFSPQFDCSLPKSLRESMKDASEERAEGGIPRQDASHATCGAVNSAVQSQVSTHLRSTTARTARPPTSCPIDTLSLDVLCEILVLVLDIQHSAASKTSFASMATFASDASQNVKSLLTLTHVCRIWRLALHGMPQLWRKITLIWKPGMRSEGHAHLAGVEGDTSPARADSGRVPVMHVPAISQTALWLARAGAMPLSFTVIADQRQGHLPQALSGITWTLGRSTGRAELHASNEAFCVNYVVELFRNPECFPVHRIQSLRLILLAEGHVAALASLPPTSFPRLEALHLSLNYNRWPSPEDAPITAFADSPHLRRLCLKVVWNAGAVERRLQLPWSTLTHLSLELPGSTRSAYLDIIRLCCSSLISLQVVEGHMLRLPTASLAELETPTQLPRLRTLRLPSGSTCLLALDPVDLAELHVDTASAPVLDAFLQSAVHVTSLSLSQIIFQGNELRRVLGSSPSLHSLSLDQCSLRFNLFFESMMVGIWRTDSCPERMQGSVYVPCLEHLRMVNCRNGTETLGELDVDLFLLMIRLRRETVVVRHVRFVELWPMRPSFAEKCRRDWEDKEELVVVLEQPRGS